ncbi:MAG: hypothetical protein ACP5C3_02595 [Methanomicrobiales archaeon]
MKNLNFKDILSSGKLEIFGVIAGIIAFISLILFIGFILIPGFAKILIYDSFIYYEMAMNPFKATIAPYTYRILTPLIVSLIPLERLEGFFLVNVSSIIIAATIFYYYLKKLNFNSYLSYLGVMLFISAPTVIYSLYDIALVDNLSFLFITLAFYFILIRKDWLFFIVLLIGVVNKETILFTIPVYFLYNIEINNLKIALKKSVLILLPILFIFMIIRFQYGVTDYFTINTIKNNLLEHLYRYNIIKNYLYIAIGTFKNPYLAFGTIWLIFLYGIKYIDNKFLKKSLYVLPLIFLQILISTDIYRVIFIAFPIIIPIALYVYKKNIIGVNLFFILISLILIICYTLLVNLNGFLFGLVILPLEIVILTSLLVNCAYKKVIQNKV